MEPNSTVSALIPWQTQHKIQIPRRQNFHRFLINQTMGGVWSKFYKNKIKEKKKGPLCFKIVVLRNDIKSLDL